MLHYTLKEYPQAAARCDCGWLREKVRNGDSRLFDGDFLSVVLCRTVGQVSGRHSLTAAVS